MSSPSVTEAFSAGHHEPSFVERARTCWIVLRISLEERLVYRGDFALGTLMRFLPLVTQVFFWGAIFANSGRTVAGYTKDEMVAYLLLTQISRAFSSMPGLASTIALQVRNGEIKKYLVQPVDLLSFLLLGRTAHKLVYYAVAAVPFAFVFFVCRGYFAGWPAPEVMAGFIASLIMSFLLGFYMEATLGLLGFWFLEIGSLLFVWMLFNFFLSGQMFPIEILPEPWDDIVRALPLQYLAYFPSAIFIGKIAGDQLVWGLLIELGWVIFFIVISRAAFRMGVKRYSGFGG